MQQSTFSVGRTTLLIMISLCTIHLTAMNIASFREDDVIVFSVAGMGTPVFHNVDVDTATLPNSYTTSNYTTWSSDAYGRKVGRLRLLADRTALVTTVVNTSQVVHAYITDLQGNDTFIPLPTSLAASPPIIAAQTSKILYVGGINEPFCMIRIGITKQCTVNAMTIAHIEIFQSVVYAAYADTFNDVIGSFSEMTTSFTPLPGLGAVPMRYIKGFTFTMPNQIWVLDQRDGRYQVFVWSLLGPTWAETGGYVINTAWEIYSLTFRASINGDQFVYAVGRNRAWQVNILTRKVKLIAVAPALTEFVGVALPPLLAPGYVYPNPPMPTTSQTPSSPPQAPMSSPLPLMSVQMPPLVPDTVVALRTDRTGLSGSDQYNAAKAAAVNLTISSLAGFLISQIRLDSYITNCRLPLLGTLDGRLAFTDGRLYFTCRNAPLGVTVNDDNDATAPSVLVMYSMNGTVELVNIPGTLRRIVGVAPNDEFVYFAPESAQGLQRYHKISRTMRSETIYNPLTFVAVSSIKAGLAGVVYLLTDDYDKSGIWEKAPSMPEFSPFLLIEYVEGYPCSLLYDFHIINSQTILLAAKWWYEGDVGISSASLWLYEYNGAAWSQVNYWTASFNVQIHSIASYDVLSGVTKVLVAGYNDSLQSFIFVFNYATGSFAPLQGTSSGSYFKGMVAISTTSPTPTVTMSPSTSRTSTYTNAGSVTNTMSVTVSCSATRTKSPSATLDFSSSGSTSASVTNTPSMTGTQSNTVSQSISPTASGSALFTSSPSRNFTAGATPSMSQSGSFTSSSTANATTSKSASSTRTSTPTASISRSTSVTRSATPSFNFTASTTRSPSGTPSATQTSTETESFTLSETSSSSASSSPSFSESNTSTSTKTASPTRSRTSSITSSITKSKSATYSGTASRNATKSMSASQSATPTATHTSTETESSTSSETSSTTSTASPTSSGTPTSTQTETASSSISSSASGSSSGSTSATEALTSSVSSTSSSSDTPSASASGTLSATSSPSTTETASVSATSTSSTSPSTSYTPSSSQSLTTSWSSSSTGSPSNSPSYSMSVSGSLSQTRTPTMSTTQAPAQDSMCGLSATIIKNVTVPGDAHAMFSNIQARCCIFRAIFRVNHTDLALSVANWRLMTMNGSIVVDGQTLNCGAGVGTIPVTAAGNNSKVLQLRLQVVPVTKHCDHFANVSVPRLNQTLHDAWASQPCLQAPHNYLQPASVISLSFDAVHLPEDEGTFTLILAAAAVGGAVLLLCSVTCVWCFISYQCQKRKHSNTGFVLHALKAPATPLQRRQSLAKIQNMRPMDASLISHIVAETTVSLQRASMARTKATFQPTPITSKGTSHVIAAERGPPLAAILMEEDLVAVEGAMQSAMAAAATAQPVRHNASNFNQMKSNVNVVSSVHAKDKFELMTTESALQVIAQSLSTTGMQGEVLQAALLVGAHIAKAVVYGDDGGQPTIEVGAGDACAFVNPIAALGGMPIPHSNRGIQTNSATVSRIARSSGVLPSVASVQRINSTAKTLTAMTLQDKMAVLQVAICAAVNTAKASVVAVDDSVDLEQVAVNALKAARFAVEAIQTQSDGVRTGRQMNGITQVTFFSYLRHSIGTMCGAKKPSVQMNKPLQRPSVANVVRVTVGARRPSGILSTTPRASIIGMAHTPRASIAPMATSHRASIVANPLQSSQSNPLRLTEEKRARSFRPTLIPAAAQTSAAKRTNSNVTRASVVRFEAMKVSASVYRKNTTRKLPGQVGAEST